jgi:TonB family protein
MKFGLASLIVFFAVSIPCFCQDLKVREEAVRLLERANKVSSSPNWPNLKRVATFRAFGEDGFHDGSIVRTVIQGTGVRAEYSFREYHSVSVETEKQIADTEKARIPPPELMEARRITPILLVQFDGEDVIRTIGDRDVLDRNARCIVFDTIKGQETQTNNEVCVERGSGVLLEVKLGPEFIEYSDFFPFAGALLPGRINYSLAGVKKLEITQSMILLNDSVESALVAPAEAQVRKFCTTFRRPFGTAMPQPPAGNGGGSVDVIVHGMVGTDGRLHEATVQKSERSDLNEEALSLVKQWTFTPGVCNGQPNADEIYLTLHFLGR